jgi:peptidoglycan/xylan/chitin deacetylase (PgdA/CDA1 family)
MRKIFYLFVLTFIVVCGCLSITNTGLETRGNKTVIFTFDDGPNAHEDTTTRLLDVLQKYNIRAVFALLGKNVEQNPYLVRRIYTEGHIIANHGYSGKWAVRMKDDEFRENLLKGEAAIAAALGAAEGAAEGEDPRPKLYRPHGGFYYQRHERIWREEGWELLGGNIRAYDAAVSGTGKQKVIRTIINKTERNRGGIILLHDARDIYIIMEKELAKDPAGSSNRSWIPDAVEEIIISLIEKGYQL